MAKKKLAKSIAGRSRQGEAAKPLGENSFETRDLKSMRGGSWQKEDTNPSVAKKKAFTKPNKAASPHASDMPEGGNYSSNRPGAYPGV